MELGLRILLLLVGLMISAGVLWDVLRNRKSSLKKEPVSEFGSADPEMDALVEEEFYVRPLQKTISKSSPVSPSSSENTTPFIILNLMAHHLHYFEGRKLLEAFKEFHLYYGNMEIFHRYENMDGSGNIVFSIANATEPGIFDISTIESFKTPGLSLFFKIQNSNQAIFAFELMLRTAKQLAARLQGELKDDKRRILTPLSIERYREKVGKSQGTKRQPILNQ